MNARVTQSGIWLVLTVLSSSALADTKWLPSPAILREYMCASRSVVIGRLTDVTVVRGSRARSGSGRIAVEKIVTGAGHVLPAIEWSDRNEIGCPRLELDQFKGRLGVWFLRVDSSGAFDGFASDFWELDTTRRILDEIQQSEPLTPELLALSRAIELYDHSPAR